MIPKIDIISGFLGAGKTQLIKKLIEENYYDKNVVIIENEFGEVSIDGEILRKSESIIKEINSGCICCQVSGDFKKSIKEIIENYEAEHIIIEPTGIAKLSEIVEIFNDEFLKEKCSIDKIITVVDCEKFYLYLNNFRNFYVDQIKYSEYVVLSRVQNVEHLLLNKVIQEIKNINNTAIIIANDWSKVSAKDLFRNNKIYIDRTTKKTKSSTIFKNIKKSSNDINSSESFQTVTVKFKRKVSSEELSNKFNFITSSKTFGNIVRAKGIVNLINGQNGQFDFTLNEYSLRNIEYYSGESIISFIGTNLNKKELESFFI